LKGLREAGVNLDLLVWECNNPKGAFSLITLIDSIPITKTLRLHGGQWWGSLLGTEDMDMELNIMDMNTCIPGSIGPIEESMVFWSNLERLELIGIGITRITLRHILKAIHKLKHLVLENLGDMLREWEEYDENLAISDRQGWCDAIHIQGGFTAPLNLMYIGIHHCEGIFEIAAQRLLELAITAPSLETVDIRNNDWLGPEESTQLDEMMKEYAPRVSLIVSDVNV